MITYFLIVAISFSNFCKTDLQSSIYNCEIAISMDNLSSSDTGTTILPLGVWENDSIIANIEIKKGKGFFSYKGEWKYLYIKDNNNKIFFVVDSNLIKIEKSKKANTYPTVSGGIKNTAWRNLIDSARQKFIPLMRANALGSPTEIEAQKLEIDKAKFISWHFNSIKALNDEGLLSLVLLNNQIHYLKVFYPSIDSSLIKDIISIKNNISDKYFKTDAYIKLEANLAQILYLRKNNEIHDFTLMGELGTPISTTDYRGKFLLVDFWATWCGPCKEKNEIFKHKMSAWKEKKLEILGVLVFSDKNTWVSVIKDYNYTWATVFCDDKKIMDRYSVQAIPKCILFSPNGKIIALNPTNDEIDKLISK